MAPVTADAEGQAFRVKIELGLKKNRGRHGAITLEDALDFILQSALTRRGASPIAPKRPPKKAASAPSSREIEAPSAAPEAVVEASSATLLAVADACCLS